MLLKVSLTRCDAGARGSAIGAAVQALLAKSKQSLSSRSVMRFERHSCTRLAMFAGIGMEVPALWRNDLSHNLIWLPIFAMALVLPIFTKAASGQTCTTQSDMDSATRNSLESTAMTTAQQIATQGQAAGASALQSSIAPQVASESAGILNSISSVAPLVKGATFIVNNLYVLDATDSPANASSTQFFCGSMNQPPHVVFTLGQLPQARYAIAMVHAEGISHPQQMTLIFAQVPGGNLNGAASKGSPSQATWKLAGFAYKPLTMAGHDGLWYWKQARVYAQQKQNWDAYFYYQTARNLVAPVDFLASSNLNKLGREQDAVKPAGLPGLQPMVLTSGSQSFSVTELHPDSFQGGLDMVIHYQAKSVQNLVETRQQNIAVMHLILQVHPELRLAFHGLWVFAVAPGQDPFGIELPVSQIP